MDAKTYNDSVTALFEHGGSLRRILEDAPRPEPDAVPPGPSPFAACANWVHTECPCGCGAKEPCEAQRLKVKAANDALEF